MREAIVWSYELLSADEQRLLAWLAVFVGGFTLEAAEIVCGNMLATDHAPMAPSTLDGIASLVDKSLLLWRDATANSRLGMLETIREFALEQLAAAGEANRARAAHAAYFANLDEWLEPNHVAPGERVDDRLWAIEAELANLRAALSFLTNAGDAEGLLRLAGSLAIFWHHRGNLAEGRQWLEHALEKSRKTATACRARALAGYSLILWSQGHLALAGPLADAAHRIAQAIDHTELTALSVHLLGLVALSEHQWAQATSHMTEALALWRSLELPSDAAMALRALAWVAYETGDATACMQRAEESLALFRALGHPSGAAGALGLLAQQAHDQGDDTTALDAYPRSPPALGTNRLPLGSDQGPWRQHSIHLSAVGRHRRSPLAGASAGWSGGHCRKSRATRPGRDAAGRRRSPLGRRGDGGERIAGRQARRDDSGSAGGAGCGPLCSVADRRASISASRTRWPSR